MTAPAKYRAKPKYNNSEEQLPADSFQHNCPDATKNAAPIMNRIPSLFCLIDFLKLW